MFTDLAAAAAVSQAPWWGVPVVAGVFGLGGVLTTLLFGHLRSKREDDRRWEKDLRSVMAGFLGAAGDFVMPQPEDSTGGHVREDDAVRLTKLNLLYAELILLAPVNVLVAAQQLNECALATVAERRENPNSEKHAESFKQYVNAIPVYLAAARAALGVKSAT